MNTIIDNVENRKGYYLPNGELLAPDYAPHPISQDDWDKMPVNVKIFIRKSAIEWALDNNLQFTDPGTFYAYICLLAIYIDHINDDVRTLLSYALDQLEMVLQRQA